MFKATQAIYDTLSASKLELKVFTEETEHSSCVWLQFSIKNGPSYRIRFISTDDDSDVAVRVFALVSVGQGKASKVLPVINELNTKYRFVKFVLDHDNDINVEYDFPVSTVRVENSAEEIILRFTKIIDETYMQLMQVVLL